MKMLLPRQFATALLLIIAPLLIGTAYAQNDEAKKTTHYKKLVSTDGTAIEAEIINSDGNTVRIRRSDRQEFSFPITMLDAKSQQLVREWATDRALSTSIEVRVRERTVDKKKANREGVNVDLLQNEIQFTLINKSEIPIDNIHIEYRIYYSVETFEDKKDTELDTSGSLKFAKLQGRSELTMPSKAIKLQETKLRANYYVPGSKKSGTKDRITGYWYRVYRGDTMIMEDSTPKRLMTTNTW